MARPLEGLVVTEAASSATTLPVRLALSMAGRLCADLGAEVIKLEPPEGDPVRRLAPLVDGTSATFAFLNAGKRSVQVAEAELPATLGRLASRAAASLVDARLAEACGAAPGGHVRAVLAMLDNSGCDEPPASELTVMALGGMLDLLGAPDRAPLKIGGSQLAYAAGLTAYTGLAAGLAARDPDRAETVRTNLLDVAIWLNWKSVAAASWGQPVPRRIGTNAEWQVIRCADGHFALVYRDPDWATLKSLIADPRLEDARFQRRAERKKHAGTVAAIVEEALAGRTREEVRALALERRLPFGPVWTIDELAADPQMIARGVLVDIPLGARTGRAPRLPLLWNGRALAPQNPATGTRR